MTKIGLLTYDIPHLKTYQILDGLINKNYYVVLLKTKFFNKYNKTEESIFTPDFAKNLKSL